jgi:hypothetical protein
MRARGGGHRCLLDVHAEQRAHDHADAAEAVVERKVVVELPPRDGATLTPYNGTKRALRRATCEV